MVFQTRELDPVDTGVRSAKRFVIAQHAHVWLRLMGHWQRLILSVFAHWLADVPSSFYNFRRSTHECAR
jgi:hypothetical protein